MSVQPLSVALYLSCLQEDLPLLFLLPLLLYMVQLLKELELSANIAVLLIMVILLSTDSTVTVCFFPKKTKLLQETNDCPCVIVELLIEHFDEN